MKTNREKFLEAFGLPKDLSLSLRDISVLTHIPEKALQEVYNRGIGAWRTNISSVRVEGTFEKNPDTKTYPRSARLGKEQWAMARVYAFVMKKPKVYYGADNDIREKYRLY